MEKDSVLPACCGYDRIKVMDKLITNYEFRLTEPPCAPGSGRYGVEIILPGDISAVFPYLNAVLDDTWYDHENAILIGSDNDRRCAFRTDEIKVAGVAEWGQGGQVAGEVVDRVNQIWQERDSITPSFAERKLPAVIDIYQLLPKTNCRKCGCLTCLAYAADLRNGMVRLEQCLPLLQSEYTESKDRLSALLPG